MKYFKTFSNCIIVKGACRSTVTDMQREEIFVISNDFATILERLNNKELITNVMESFDLENQKIIQENLNYLEENEYGFFCNEAEFECFPELNKKFEVPNDLTNIVAEFTTYNFERLSKIKTVITHTNCESITLVFYISLNKKELNEILYLFNGTTILSIDIVLKYNTLYVKNYFLEIEYTNRLNSLIIHSCPFDKYFNIENYGYKITFIEKVIKDFSFCGEISKDYFTKKQKAILEAINYNSCLYKKLGIDKKGEIKNCPAIKISFHNIDSITPIEIRKLIQENSEFKRLGKISKDTILVCKDCEFKYACSDCRAYLENPDDNYSKPLKCGYNPYTNEWSEWSKNPLKQKAIEYYKLF